MKDYTTSRFKRRIRISEENLEFIRRTKGKYTLAGMLDKIINQHKNENKWRTAKVPKTVEAKTATHGAGV